MEVMKRSDHEIADPSAEYVAAWLATVSELERAPFEPLASFDRLPDGAGVLADSRTWAGRFLTDAASPYRQDLEVRRSIHPAAGDLPDVLRQQYALAFREDPSQPPFVLDVDLMETAAWLRVEVRPRGVELAKVDEAERVRAVSWMAARVLRLHGVHRGRDDQDQPHEWVFSYRRLDEGARFSTNPAQDQFAMWSWADRVDGGIGPGQLYFLGFKHHEPAGGRKILLDQKHWFDGQCWAPFRR